MTRPSPLIAKCVEGIHPRARAARLGDDSVHLGCVLHTLGTRESGTAKLDEAVAAYREALKERTRERVPIDWATTLGNGLRADASRRAADAAMAETALSQSMGRSKRCDGGHAPYTAILGRGSPIPAPSWRCCAGSNPSPSAPHCPLTPPCKVPALGGGSGWLDQVDMTPIGRATDSSRGSKRATSRSRSSASARAEKFAFTVAGHHPIPMAAAARPQLLEGMQHLLGWEPIIEEATSPACSTRPAAAPSRWNRAGSSSCRRASPDNAPDLDRRWRISRRSRRSRARSAWLASA